MWYWVLVAAMYSASIVMWYYAGKIAGRNQERKRNEEFFEKFTKLIANKMVKGEYDEHVQQAAMLRAEREVAERYYKGGSG